MNAGMNATRTVTPAYMRPIEAASYMSVSPRTVRDWMRRGIIPHHKPCRKVCLFAVADLDKAMRRFRVEAIGATGEG